MTTDGSQLPKQKKTMESNRAPVTMAPNVGLGTSRTLVRVGRVHINVREVALPAAVVALVVLFAILSNVFLTVGNFQNVALQASALALVSFGQCFVVLTAGIDLSVGSTAALVSVVAALGMSHIGFGGGLVLAILAGIGVGIVNGGVVTLLGVVPFVTTLAMLSIASGVALMLSGGTPVVGVPSGFTNLANSLLGGVPVPFIIAVAFLLVASLLLRDTRLGRYLYAIGGNAEAARLSGINVRAVTLTAYMLCSLFTALGGLILTSRVASGQPTLGSDLALQSVTAVVLGGVSLFGGRGSIVGVAFGVAFVSILSNGMNLIGVSSYVQMVVLGSALIAVLAIDWRFSRRGRSGG